MSPTPSFREELISQIPALQLLTAMGYTTSPPTSCHVAAISQSRPWWRIRDWKSRLQRAVAAIS